MPRQSSQIVKFAVPPVPVSGRAGKIFPAHFCLHPRKIYKIKLIRANIKTYPSKMNGVNLINVKFIVYNISFGEVFVLHCDSS